MAIKPEARENTGANYTGKQDPLAPWKSRWTSPAGLNVDFATGLDSAMRFVYPFETDSGRSGLRCRRLIH
jgi:hypothetical protein